jgi:uncharacterized iron-regulated membrane protein
MRARRLVRQVHGWVGALTAVFLLLIALSGASLAFMSEIFLAQYGDTLRSEAPGTPSTDLDAMVASGRAMAGPDFQPYGLLMPHSRVPGVETAMLFGIRPHAGSADYPWMVSIDPATSSAKGMFRLDEALGHELIDFHYQLLAGETGTAFVAALGLLLVAFSLSGFWLWWPGRRRARAKLGYPSATSRRANLWFVLHGWAGLWASIAIAFFALTGVATAKPDWLGISEPAHEAPPSAGFARQCAGSVSVAQAVAAAARLLPDARVTMLDFPDGPGRPYTLYLHRAGDWNAMEGDTLLLVHSKCPGVVHRINLTEGGLAHTADAAAFSLHGGYSFGPVIGDILVIITGLSLAFLSVSGLLSFVRMQGWIRRRTRQEDQQMDAFNLA